MSSPRDRDRDGFDDGAGWQEPAHLGEGAGAPAGRPEQPADPAPDGWQPPGWDLPAVEPERTIDRPLPPPAPAPVPPPAPGPAPDRSRPDAERAFADQGDPWGTLAWAASIGWSSSDGTGPEDAALAELVRSAPVRPGKEDRPGNVVRGRGPGIDLVACDIVSPLGRDRWVSTHAITAAPLLGAVPGFRLSPARFWKHRTGGLLQLPSGDPEFDARWVLLAAEDGPAVRGVVASPEVRQLLLGSDDGDELWSAAGFVAAVRPDGQRPALVEHQARILTAVVAALAAGA
ncbi:hypothetical protein [Modestobacter sp. NPDC049651]|uniref:hypothetical protein n=1 Tax=unclassified Modestobacter TaxID=2643866 RepID=UPI0033E8C36C